MSRHILLPGDQVDCEAVAEKLRERQGRIRLGPGLRQEHDRIVATKCGVLRSRGQDKLWVEGTQRQYVRSQGDAVVGVVLEKLGDTCKVDIGDAAVATLSMTAFEGATKKNRPNVDVGGLVYARVAVANKDMEPIIECVDANGKASGFGPLKGGTMFSVSLNLARRLLAPDCCILAELSRYFPFETATGKRQNWKEEMWAVRQGHCACRGPSPRRR